MKKLIVLLIIIVFWISCKDKQAMGEQNIRIIELYVKEILTNGTLSMADSIIGDEFVDPASVAGEKGPEPLKRVISYFRSTFPDLKVTIDEIVTHNDKVAWKWTAHGTHQGEIFGIAPTNKRVSFSGIIIDKIIDGKIVHRHGIWDRLALREQLLER
jgi:predicted ester cyclase